MNLQETTRCKEHRRADESRRYSGLADIQATLSAGIWPSKDINQETTSHNHDLDVAPRCFPEYTVRYNPSRTMSVIFWTNNALISVIYVGRNARSYLLREKYISWLTSHSSAKIYGNLQLFISHIEYLKITELKSLI